VLTFSHVGDGNVHSLALFTNEAELEIVRHAVHEMVYRAIRLDGTCSGEHGVGLGKVEYLETELGEGTVGLMETIKRTGECKAARPFDREPNRRVVNL
jgi:D-lactate dehydrogenase (cytochrome)